MKNNGFMGDLVKCILKSIVSVVMICAILNLYPDLVPTLKVKIEIQNQSIPVHLENHKLDVRVETGYNPLKVEASTAYSSDFKIKVQ